MATLLFLVGWLVSRLILILYDDPLPRRILVFLGLAQLAYWLLTLAPNAASAAIAVLAFIVLLVPEIAYTQRLNEMRLAGTLLLLSALIVFHPYLSQPSWLNVFDDPISWLESDNGSRVLWFLIGILILANEANLLIRSLFRITNLEPLIITPTSETGTASRSNDVDKREYNAGRIIGILERWLMYSVLVTSQDYTVIAIVIAAKGFARFRELDKREFAEYVLIGTLTSTLIAVAMAQILILGIGRRTTCTSTPAISSPLGITAARSSCSTAPGTAPRWRKAASRSCSCRSPAVIPRGYPESS